MRGRATAWIGAAWIAALASPLLALDSAADQAARRGTELFWLDRAAWVTSDDMAARLPGDRRMEIASWIVVPDGDGYHAYWLGKDEAADSIVYEADMIGNKVINAVIHPKAGAPRLPAVARKMAEAQQIAWREIEAHKDWRPCADAPFNTVVLPPQSDGTIPVYFLTPQTVARSFPFGGHFEVVVAADGKISSSRRFTNACLEMRPAQGAVATTLSHSLDRQPTEIHVFQQYALGMPLFVGIASTKAVWKVENGRVDLVSPPE